MSYVGRFYRNIAQNVNSAVGPEFYDRTAADATIQAEDVQNYLLAISDFGKGMQDDINLYVTPNRLNNARFRQKLHSIANNIFRRQNPLRLMFKDISTFDAQNPIAGSLLKELNLRKKDRESTLIKKAFSTADVKIQSRLNALKSNLTFYNLTNNNSNNLPLPPFQRPPTFPPPLSLLTNFISPPPSPVSNNFDFLKKLPRASQTTSFGELTIGEQERTSNGKKQKVLRKQLDDTLSELPKPPKFELDSFLNVLSAKANDILSTDYKNHKELNEKEIEEIKEKYKFENIKNTLGKGNIPQQLEYFFGGDNEYFIIACNLLGLSKNNK